MCTPEHARAALDAIKTDRNAVKAIQSALIEAQADLGSYGADGSAGALTRAAVEAHPEVALNAIAAYIDETDNKNVEARLVSEKPADSDAIDAALAELSENSSVEDIIALANRFTDSSEVGANVRNKNAQYIALKLQSMGLEDAAYAGVIMEKVMAEGAGHYEQNTVELQIREALKDGSGRFARHLGNFPENFNGSYYKIRQTLQNGRTRVENGMETGLSGNASEILQALFGVNGEYVATRVHVVTGQGRDGDVDMSVELAGGVELSNAYYDEASGAIYAVVAKGNGCEGNLVVIPVETFVKPRPKPVVRPRPQEPARPQEPDLPEQPTRIIKNKWCDRRTSTYWVQWGYEWIPGGESVDTGESCNPGWGWGGWGGWVRGVGSDANGDVGHDAQDNGNGANGPADSNDWEE